MKETEIAEMMVAYLESAGWDIYQEVKLWGRIADIVAVHDDWLTWVIECKKNLSLDVMQQASFWLAHYRSIVVPMPKKTRGRKKRNARTYRVAHQFFNVGVFEVDVEEDEIDEIRSAPLMRQYHNTSKQILSSLMPEHKTHAKAGSNIGGYWTPYKSTIRAVENYIRNHPGCTLKELIDNIGKHHYSSSQSAIQTLRKNLQDLHSDWCNIDKSKKAWLYYHKETNTTK